MAGLINRVLHSKLKNATHWSVRSVAEETAIFKSTVARYFALFGLQPHRSKSFRLCFDSTKKRARLIRTLRSTGENYLRSCPMNHFPISCHRPVDLPTCDEQYDKKEEDNSAESDSVVRSIGLIIPSTAEQQ